MASFGQVINPMTGENTWQERDENYDYHQEVANAGFGDMLHDWERNQKYDAALRKTIAAMREAGREVHVLDIGTGTGILAMMALRAGADTVTACEAFMPMANCAQRILNANGYGDRVRLIRKRSTDIEMGVDMPHRANLLVAELLDTELIGEGAIGIYNHAHNELLTADALCIPARATCYAQAAQSALATQWNSLKMLASLDGDILLKPPAQLLQCSGEAALHDVQLSQLPIDSFHVLTAPTPIFQFDFQRKQAREQQRENILRLQIVRPGSVELIFYWWQIELDDRGEQLLSCAPYWAHPELAQLQRSNSSKPLANVVPWRDHWMQAIYYIPKPLQLHTAGEQFYLRCYHDEYSLWFDAHQTEPPSQPARRHCCTCDLHMTYTRNRIGQLNQGTRNKRYLRYLEQAVHAKESAHLLVLGDGCLLGLASSALGAGSVRCLEPHRFSRRLLGAIAKHNQLKNVSFVESVQQLQPIELAAITHIFAEPYFLNSILPWDNFYFGTLLLQLLEQIPALSVQISPCAARIYALPVEFLDLHKIRTPIGSCEGFDLRLFDDMVQRSAEQAVALVEAQPLWEYPCRALAQPQQLLNVNFDNFGEDKHSHGCLQLTASGDCNGVALWVDWQLAADESPRSIVSSGPSETVVPGQLVKWDMFVRQGVHFISQPTKDRRQTDAGKRQLDWSINFKPRLGELNFNFSLRSSSEKSE
ncbi:protein arginine N-methyltransferase 7 isoform X1 [Drosophila grimshawi]|uniref:Protein arginine N-methyltransferase 7 n=2 Tax=Drosophila grimshawi TaxID=7222 RepID=ANM7_DROGR|nr:protein arginine N-methyltransferase 7 isoform X1 [Drosophila grimshawi]B4JWL5.1 RecName: Full=Protein arginine N-methyltransferase 7 [Drosophila grimshawi]EDV98353.1 GH23070 [Drosophila grimshawi]